ncbi:MAG: DUF6464 family protein [Chroococcales cyanobacterium]
MLETIFIVILSLLPSLISLILLRRAKQRFEARLRDARLRPVSGQRYSRGSSANDFSTEIGNYFVGNLNCRYNAHSPYLRCAVNPSGPCENCRFYEAKY